MKKFKIGNTFVGQNSKTYFIADIAANHDGSLSRAKKLIRLCAKAGADAAKFQHFKAETIVSKFSFDNMKSIAHQSSWQSSVFDVYKKASINMLWTKELKKECKKNKIDFFTSPYDLDYVDSVEPYIDAYKIGSGDITWKDILIKISHKKKPIIIATGASNLKEVLRAYKILKRNKKLVIMQCNTNYTIHEDNFNNINLNVLKNFKKRFKNNAILGLSDHTPGHATVLGAVALGARVIEKHFTDSNARTGPDHSFSMNPNSWADMIYETRRLEKSLGNGIKKVERNEKDSVIVQRRSIKAKTNLKKGSILSKNNITFLRPCEKNDIDPFDVKKVLNKKIKKDLKKGESLTWKKIY
jgi:N-acetylneuraminate synthase